MPDSSPTDPVANRKKFTPSDQPGTKDTPSAARPENPIPVKIGPYHIRRRIASAGMGTVYEAMQEKPRRTVAVKVMNHGITSRNAMRRFEYEAQFLARLHHPGIAEVYEAGTYDDGSGAMPYFAMEYIPNAKRITDFAAEKALDMRGRITMLAQVCDAVQHGHQRGIIHRDLKPANILIDSHGQVKVIDFGVARSTDSDLAVTTLQTDVGQLIGTLQYMSPEQCEADPRDLDARSDVYALGVVLYEILCNRLPYDLTGMAISAATKVIRQFQPPRPSVVVSSLRGDVETILLKALEKDRERRYRSAADFGDDLRRYLNKEPVQARPPSLVYQVRVFARRNRLVFVAVAAVLLAVTAGLIVSTLLYFEAARQRDAALTARGESDAVTKFLNDTLASVDPRSARGPGVTVLEMLDDAADKISGAFENQPLVEAALRRTIGNSYIAMERYAAAEAQLQVALQLRQRNCPQEGVAVAESEHALAVAMHGLGRRTEAEELYRRALVTRRKVLGNDHPEVAETLEGLSVCLCELGRNSAAEPLLREALGIRRQVFGNDHRLVAHTLANLGGALQMRGQYSQAADLHAEALTILRNVVGADHISVAYTLNLLGQCAWKMGDLPAAEEHLREALAISAKLRDSQRGLRGNVLSALGDVLHEQGKLHEAELVKREAFQVYSELRGDDDPDSARCATKLADCLREQQKIVEAEVLARKALAIQRRLPKVEPADLADTLLTLGITLIWNGDYSGAEPLLRESLSVQRGRGPPNPMKWAVTVDALGVTLSESGKADEAEPLIREAVEEFSAAYGADEWRTANARGHLGDAWRRLGRMKEAERELTDAYRILSAAREPRDVYRVRTVDRLVALYETWDAAEPGKGYAEKAAEWREKLDETSKNQGAEMPK